MTVRLGVFNPLFTLFAVVFVALQIYIQESSGEVYSCHFDLQSIQHSEEEMFKVVERYMQAEEKRLKDIQRILVERVEAGILKAGHPVGAYHLINFWNMIARKVSDNSSALMFKKYLWMLELPEIDEGDVEGAARGLLRLQKTYNLSTESISKGRIAKKKSTPLDSVDSYNLGIQARRSEDYRLAVEWFDAAMDSCCHPENDTVDKQQIRMDIAETYFLAGDYEEAVKQSKQVRIQRHDLRGQEFLQKIQKFREHKEQFRSNKTRARQRRIDPDRQRYTELCRGEVPQTSHQRPEIFCRVRNPLNYYKWNKEEILSIDPWISVLYDLITDNEGNQFKQMASAEFERGLIGNVSADGQYGTSEMRVAKISWLREENLATGVGNELNKRIGMVTGLSTTMREVNTVAEPLQVSNYGIGGQYEPHLDTFHDFDQSLFPPILRHSGDRVATVMIYLNKVKAGGSTVFPPLNITVKPVKNAALFWFNMKRSGQYDNRTIHAGCPVLLGGKWVANKWIHEIEQEHRRPCGTRVDDTDADLEF